jgi:hypothetical protein
LDAIGLTLSRPKALKQPLYGYFSLRYQTRYLLKRLVMVVIGLRFCKYYPIEMQDMAPPQEKYMSWWSNRVK